MHSSRMRTVRCSGHLGVGVCLGGGVQGGVCLEGVCLGGVKVGVCLGGVHLHPWTEFLTHAFENITFPQLLLRTVKREFSCI